MAKILEIQKREERQLVNRVLRGEELAWKQFLLRYKKTIITAIRSHLRKFSNVFDEHREEDVYQDVLAKLHRIALGRFLENTEAQSMLRSYIYTVALNHTKDFVSSKLGQSALQEVGVDSGFDEENSNTVSEAIFTNNETVEELCIQNEMRALLLDEILRQDLKTQEILKLYLLGEKNKEISHALGLQEGRVNKVVFNFKAHLIKKYSKQKSKAA